MPIIPSEEPKAQSGSDRWAEMAQVERGILPEQPTLGPGPCPLLSHLDVPALSLEPGPEGAVSPCAQRQGWQGSGRAPGSWATDPQLF